MYRRRSSNSSTKSIRTFPLITNALLVNERIRSVLTRRKQIPWRLNVVARYIDIRSDESRHGADIGLTAEIIPTSGTRPFASFKKACLIQAKRLHLSRYDDAFDDSCFYSQIEASEEQSQKMLNITPSSFYWLYGPAKIQSSTRGTLRTLGLRVLPATIVAGLTTKPPNAEFIRKSAISFAEFMVDEFLACLVGDPRQQVINIAMGEIVDYPVEHAINISLEPYRDLDYQQEPFRL